MQNLFSNKEYYLFNLSGGRKKVKLLIRDILLVTVVKDGHMDKEVYLKGNLVYKIRGCSLERFISITGFLQRINKQELVSPEIVNYLDEDSIYLWNKECSTLPKFLSLNRNYKKAFLKYFNYA